MNHRAVRRQSETSKRCFDGNRAHLEQTRALEARSRERTRLHVANKCRKSGEGMLTLGDACCYEAFWVMLVSEFGLALSVEKFACALILGAATSALRRSSIIRLRRGARCGAPLTFHARAVCDVAVVCVRRGVCVAVVMGVATQHATWPEIRFSLKTFFASRECRMITSLHQCISATHILTR